MNIAKYYNGDWKPDGNNKYELKYCWRARNLAKDATFRFFNNESSLGFYIGCLCKDKTFYESLVKLLNDTEKRFQYKFDIL